MPILTQPLKIPQKERITTLTVRRCQIDVIDGAFVLVDKDGIREQVPIGGISCLLLEPGTRISHAAVTMAANVRCLLIWVGEGAHRTYSAGRMGGARSDRLLYQAKVALDETARLNVVRYMYKVRFGEEPPARRSVDQLRGIEGARVRQMYKNFSKQYGVAWHGRKYDPKKWDESDDINRALSTATSSLYGICEAAILAAGYAPSIGFIHTGKNLSFVYDIADLIKFNTVVPFAFQVIASNVVNVEKELRTRCRDLFRKEKILKKLIPMIDEVLRAGGLDAPPALREGQIPPAIPAPIEEA